MSVLERLLCSRTVQFTPHSAMNCRLRFVFILVLIGFAVAPVQAQQPVADSASAQSPLVDSLHAAMDRFESQSPPTAADSSRLRHWIDSLRTKGDELPKWQTQRALALSQRVLQASRVLGDSVEIAKSVGDIGAAYTERSQFDVAEKRLQEALELSRSVGSRSEVAANLGNLGNVYKARGQYEKAQEYYQEALSIQRGLGDQEVIAGLLNNLADVLVELGRLDKALERFHEARQLFNELDNQYGIAATLTNIGRIYETRSNYERALSNFERALNLFREIGEQGAVAVNLANLGALYSAQGQHEKALDYYQEALSIFQAFGASRQAAKALQGIGRAKHQKGQDEEAFQRFQEALDIYRKIGAQSEVANMLGDMGEIYLDGGNTDKGLDHLREALSISRNIGDKKQEAENLMRLSGFHLTEADTTNALQKAQRAQAIGKEVGYPSLELRSMGIIGLIRLASGRKSAGADTLEKAAQIADRVRLNATSPEARRNLLSSEVWTYESLSLARASLDQPRLAIQAGEKSRARLLSERLAGVASRDTTFKIPSISELQRTVEANEAAIYYVDVGPGLGLSAFTVTQDTIQIRELPDSTFRARFAEEHAVRLNRLRREEGPMKEALNPRFSVPDNELPALPETIRLYRKHLTSSDRDSTTRADLGARFYDLLIAPLEEQIEEKNELIVVPTGALGYLPFETLRDSTGQYLIENKRVRYAQSLTVLHQLQERNYANRERPLLAFGGAAYEPDPDMKSGTLVAEAQRGSTRVTTETHASTLFRSAENRMERGKSPRPTYEKLGYRVWADLPGTKQEVQKLGKIEGSRSTVITGKGASEDTVRALSESGALSKYRRAHFATHGIAVPEAPGLSALVLSQVGASDSLATRDGYLNMQEIAGLDLRADVAVLSACQTGFGRLIEGEGVVSLSHAFLRAGANATLVSQWKVLDKSTRQFMTAVYKRAKNGDTSFAEAVTETKRAFIEGEHGGKNTDPLRWAPFVYYGRE